MRRVVHSSGHDLSFPSLRVSVSAANPQEPGKETVSQKGKMSSIISLKVF